MTDYDDDDDLCPECGQVHGPFEPCGPFDEIDDYEIFHDYA